MPQAAYDVITIPLGVVTAGTRIAKIGNSRVSFVGLLSYPAGVQASLRFGQGPEVPITDKWSGIDFTPPHDQGIYYSVPAIQAGSVTLFVGYWQPCE
jgi:hypothetical protein